MYHQVFIRHSAYKSYKSLSGPPRVRLQSVLDHQFRIEFPSTGKKRDPSIPGARISYVVSRISSLQQTQFEILVCLNINVRRTIVIHKTWLSSASLPSSVDKNLNFTKKKKLTLLFTHIN